jgi:threonine/homoserine/homoserine lactone efflux protein
LTSNCIATDLVFSLDFNVMEINLPLYLAFAWFVWVGSITPGPNCSLALAIGIHHGVAAVWRHALGICLGLTILMLLGLWGSLDLLQVYPLAAQALKLFGIAYLVYLGYSFIKAANAPMDDVAASAPARAKIMRSALMQVSNPKAWLLITGTLGAYQGLAKTFWANALIILLTFYIAIGVSVLIWAWMGHAIRAWLNHGQRMRVFNLLLGLSLILTAAWLLFQ